MTKNSITMWIPEYIDKCWLWSTSRQDQQSAADKPSHCSYQQ